MDKRGGYQRDSYYTSGAKGALGESQRDDRLASKALMVGVSLEGQAKAYPIEVLGLQPVVNDSVGGEEILVFLEQATDTALVYRRQVNGEPHTFELYREGVGADAVLVDNETGSKWLALSGRAFEGPLAGSTLERSLSHLSFWFAWNDWHPDTALFGENTDPTPSP